MLLRINPTGSELHRISAQNGSNVLYRAFGHKDVHFKASIVPKI